MDMWLSFGIDVLNVVTDIVTDILGPWGVVQKVISMSRSNIHNTYRLDL